MDKPISSSGRQSSRCPLQMCQDNGREKTSLEAEVRIKEAKDQRFLGVESGRVGAPFPGPGLGLLTAFVLGFQNCCARCSLPICEGGGDTLIALFLFNHCRFWRWGKEFSDVSLGLKRVICQSAHDFDVWVLTSRDFAVLSSWERVYLPWK